MVDSAAVSLRASADAISPQRTALAGTEAKSGAKSLAANLATADVAAVKHHAFSAESSDLCPET